ncbi:AMP-binding protein [Comamonas sp. JUb58]|uniref:AMP-binding protein n=1 Tax=Comamonas sp. JUb58 TaxID=2485114 RepID=UPI0010E10E7C|nr:AMP-binding protein [Comamonas sp. JUb58]TDS69620.1 fatty-acyl-CoA synthase [Comamonas sp. JUb58]
MLANKSIALKISSLAEVLEYAAGSLAGLRIFDASGKQTEHISYRDLYLTAEKRARQFQALKPNILQPAIIGLFAQTNLSFITDFFACQLAGITPCPVPPPAISLGLEEYVQRTKKMLAAVQAKALLFDATHAPLFDFFERLASSDAPNLQLIHATSLPTPGGVLAQKPQQDEDAAYIQLSSGTTHAPKGIQISQQAVCRNLHTILHEGLKIQPSDKAFSWLPLHHDMGLVGFLLAPLMGAVPLDLLPSQAFARRPQVWPKLMAQLGSTISFAPSFAWGLAADRTSTTEAQQMQLKLRIAGVGGDMVRTHDLNRFAHRFADSGFSLHKFHPCYGLAEATLAVGMGSSPQNSVDRLSNSQPLSDWEVRIVDDVGSPLPKLQAGHIHIRGPSLMTGYWKQGQLFRLAPQEWFHTDDIGHFTQSGELVVTGRAQSLLLVRGRKVQAEAIELAACAALELSHGSVMAYQDHQSTRIVIVVECSSRAEVLRQQWIETIREVVFHVCGDAADILLVPPRTIRLTTSGKIARRTTLERLNKQRR